MRAVILILLLSAAPAFGEPLGRLYSIDELVATGEKAKMIDAFNRAAVVSMYHPKCDCLVYMNRGELRRSVLPLNDAARNFLIDGLRKGYITPVTPDGPGL